MTWQDRVFFIILILANLAEVVSLWPGFGAAFFLVLLFALIGAWIGVESVNTDGKEIQ